jgi:hypothetical protein
MALPSSDIDATDPGTILEFDSDGFDATRVFSPTVAWDGSRYVMLYGGLPFGNSMQIGLATSADGATWTRQTSDPVISNAASQPWGSFREIPISVVYENGTYKLWFFGDNRNSSGESGYGSGFGLATSTDAINWTWDPGNPIRWELNAPQGNGFDLTEVVKLGGQYHAYFTDQDPAGDVLTHAVSTDGIAFSGDASLALPEGYQLRAATTAKDGSTEYVFGVFEKDGAQHYGTSLDGVNFEIQGGVDLPPEFSTGDALIKDGQVNFFGTVGVGNVNWGFGNAVIRSATAELDSGEAPSILSIEASDADKPEGNSGTVPFTFTVARSGGTGEAVTFTWQVVGAGTSPADEADFAGGGLPSGIATIPAGQAVITFDDEILVAGDALHEADEAFAVTISNPSPNVSINPLDESASGTIRNDDAASGEIDGSLAVQAATLAGATYADSPIDPKDDLGWKALPLRGLDGRYNEGVQADVAVQGTNFHSTAHTYIGEVEGETVVALAFRGTDEPDELSAQKWKFYSPTYWTKYLDAHGDLLSALTGYMQGEGSTADTLLITGHSLGGILAEEFAARYFAANPALQDKSVVVTFGSPGAYPIAPGTIVNFVHNGDRVAGISEVLKRGEREGNDIFVTLPDADRSHPEGPDYVHRTSLYLETVTSLDDNLGKSYLPADVINQDLLSIQRDLNYAVGHNNAGDTLRGGSRTETYFGLDGQDTVFGTNRPEVIDGGGDNDTIYSDLRLTSSLSNNGSRDRVFGQSGEDTIYTYGGDDEVHAGIGRDTIAGGVGNDTIYGDEDSDTVVFQGRSTQFRIETNDLYVRVVDVSAPGNQGTDTLYEVESLKFNDSIINIGNAGDFIV